MRPATQIEWGEEARRNWHTLAACLPKFLVRPRMRTPSRTPANTHRPLIPNAEKMGRRRQNLRYKMPKISQTWSEGYMEMCRKSGRRPGALRTKCRKFGWSGIPWSKEEARLGLLKARRPVAGMSDLLFNGSYRNHPGAGTFRTLVRVRRLNFVFNILRGSLRGLAITENH